MQMPVIVGIIVALVFLVAFSGWFYNVVSGWGNIIIDDALFYYRIAGASLISILVFVGVGVVTECKNPPDERVGVFASISCKEYSAIRTATKDNLESGEEVVDEVFDE